MSLLHPFPLCLAAAAAAILALPAGAQAPSECAPGGGTACGDEARSFRIPAFGPHGRATVISPSRRGVEAQIVPLEYRVLIPGCHQREAGVFLCETVHEYQHCRTLMRAGKIFACRAGLAFDGAFAEPVAAGPDAYSLEIESNVELTVRYGDRGAGEARGQARFEVEFNVPALGEDAMCLQRDRYVYYPTGPKGGLAEIDDMSDCGEPIEGVIVPHEDDVLQAYETCNAFAAWGSELEQPIELMVAALFHLGSAHAAKGGAQASRIVASYVTVSAPMQVICAQ